jgi:hypothetical protein
MDMAESVGKWHFSNLNGTISLVCPALSKASMNWKLLKKIALLLTGWRVVLFMIGAFAPSVLSFQPSYPYFSSLLLPLGPDWLVKWAGFDGVHYLTIVQKGYLGTGLIQAFFPMYPLLVHVLSRVMNPIVAGLFLSHLACIGAMYVWTQIVALHNKQIVWWQACLPFLLFPTALFFGAFYTESLFLFFVLSSYFFMKKEKVFFAAVGAALASATRVVGVTLVPMMLLYLLLSKKKNKIPWLNLGIALLGVCGLAAYMIYLQLMFHDPLYFLHVQAEFGGGRQENLILLPQVLFRYLKIFITPHTWTWSYYAYAQELILTLIFLATLTWLTVKQWKTHLAELLYSWSVVLIPPLTGTLQSMPRYVIAAFPIFLVWTNLRLKHPKMFWCLCAVSTALLVLNIFLFIQGYWVA